MNDVGPAWLRAWKRLPHPVRKGAHLAQAAWLDIIRPTQVRLRWRPGRPAAEPVVVVGLFSVASGIGASARLFADGLEVCGVRVIRHDAAAAIRHPSDLAVAPNSSVSGGMVVSHLNPPELRRWLSNGGARLLRGRRHVGYWSWELPDPPPNWADAARFVDGVLCQSTFTAQALRSLSPTLDVDVLAHPVAVSFGAPRLEPASRLDGTCVFLTQADFNSSAARKNPLGAVQAWLRAFPVADTARQRLICKLRHVDQDLAAYASILTASQNRPDVEVLTETLSVPDMAALMDRVDVVVSLHRAEGFGLGPAEALWRGKAVVATAWSGSEDYLDDAWAERVAWTAAPVDDPQGRYEGEQWAEPDLDDAAQRLRRLAGDPAYRCGLRRQGAIAAARIFDPAAWGLRARNLLGLQAVAPEKLRR